MEVEAETRGVVLCKCSVSTGRILIINREEFRIYFILCNRVNGCQGLTIAEGHIDLQRLMFERSETERPSWC